jgi:hypothetical protein
MTHYTVISADNKTVYRGTDFEKADAIYGKHMFELALENWANGMQGNKTVWMRRDEA